MNAIPAILPRGYTTSEARPRKGQRELHKPRKFFTVEYCPPLEMYRKGAQFGVEDVTNKYWGMLSGGCFTENTVLIDPQGVRKIVKKGPKGYYLE